MEQRTADHSGLRRGAMGAPELVAQAIANIAPSAVIAFTPAAIYLTAAGGTWLSFLVATIVILCVGYCIASFARRRASAGSLYNYASAGLGHLGAYVTGVALIIGCFGIASGSLGGAVVYVLAFLEDIGITFSGTVANVITTIVLGGLAALFTVRGVRLSARTALVLEILSITIITILLFVALIRAGGDAWDPSQFSLEGASTQGIATGVVLGILGFVGFSSADALGREARNPFTAIPRAIMWSAFGVGILYILAAYTQVALLGDGLTTSAAPLVDLTEQAGMPDWYGPILTFGVAASFFAVVVAPLNVIGRIAYVMGREGVAPRFLGTTHDHYLTPDRALLAYAPGVVAVTAVLYAFGVDGMDIVVWVDTFGTYGYMVAYAVVAVAAPIYLSRIGVTSTLVWPAAIIAVVAMVYVFYANVYPVPAYPLNIIPFIFLAFMAVAGGWYLYLRSRHPSVIEQVGTTETDILEGI